MTQPTATTGSLDTAAIREMAQAHVLNTYGQRTLAFVRGEGMRLWDAEDRAYLDFFAGIAVVNLGHCHPAVTQAITDQAARLVHTSNLYCIEPQAHLAALLCEHTFADKWFFCNSGAEANEAALKLARRYWAQQDTPRPVIVSAVNSFHGRTLGALTATGQPKFHAGFEPLPEGFRYVNYDDIDALDAALTPDVGAVLLEPIQGEAGVRMPSENYLAEVRRLCDARNVLLILDEVQTGMGRTGKLFAHEHAGITPDIMTISKALGNGIPIGAMGCTDRVSEGLSVGTHGSTFGGNPLCAAAALTTLQTLLDDGIVEHTSGMGAYFLEGLGKLKTHHPQITEVRGKGLMIGIELSSPAAPVLEKLLHAGILCGPAGPNVVRILPPLIVSRDEIDEVLEALDHAIRAS